ncbi:unnamed protein product [Linum tenue]|uniref:MAT1 centre domain-containing protein n=1 Tax=Linum tenue TaxID=586396 RepID=A0AAV0ICP9_9ROSI|nr:unnamed protein product [Linum tenue]CAI0394702.1 unnamed protein product [Linum tenue]
MGVGNNNPKEIAIRRNISSIFNKREEDFPSLTEYNDYLEEVEDMIFNLVSNPDTQATEAIKARIEEYKIENAEQIMLNQARKAEEYAKALAACKGLPQQTDTELNSQAMLGIETTGQYAPIMATGQPLPMGQPGSIWGDGHDDEEMMRLRAERGSRAGGWTAELSRKRSLEEAFTTIWI